jgi:hypothetical protein
MYISIKYGAYSRRISINEFRHSNTGTLRVIITEMLIINNA